MSIEVASRGPSRINWHRLIYGEWWWALRDPLDVLRLAFVGGTVAFALMGRSTAVGLTAASALLLICRIIDLPLSSLELRCFALQPTVEGVT